MSDRVRDVVQRQARSYDTLMLQQQAQEQDGAVTQEVTPPEPELVSAEDAFNAAFDELHKPEDGGEPTDDGTDTEGAPAKPAEGLLPDPAVVAEEARQTAAEAAAARAGGKEPVQAETPPVTQPVVTGSEDMFARLLAEIQKGKEPVTPEPTAPEPFKVTPYKDDEVKIIDDFMKDWPEVAAAQELIRSREYEGLHNVITTQVSAVLIAQQQELGELRSALQHLLGQSGHQQITKAVPDYDAVRDDVVKWVGEQPAYLKKAYEDVISKGSMEDSIDLINRWRTATGKEVPAAVPAVVPRVAAPTPRPAAPRPRVPPGLVPVPSKRTTPPPASGVPASYDDAFEMFSKLQSDRRAG